MLLQFLPNIALHEWKKQIIFTCTDAEEHVKSPVATRGVGCTSKLRLLVEADL
jgi:hypothetical protein